MAAPLESVDLVEELRLRRMAREQYLPPSQRDGLHPITLDELKRMDAEGIEPVIHPDDDTVLTDDAPAKPGSWFGSRLVPLMPNLPGWHGPHEIAGPHAQSHATVEREDMHYT
ncbi:MAG: hypothetical protein KDA93_22700 [Planctomycetaceae bacterium]|nr:hypothetical protein [Planctomycetaceae bacterium]